MEPKLPRSRHTWFILFLVIVLVLALPGIAAAQQPPDIIIGISPTSATQGDTGVVVTITLQSESPPTPPLDAALLGVTIGTIDAVSFTRDSLTQVSAVFDIPIDASTGMQDVSLTFEGPGGEPLTFLSADAFEILPAGPPQPLSIVKTVELSQVPVQLGDPITYTVVVANGGDEDALGVQVTDILPDGVIGDDLDWTGTVPAGEQVEFVLPVQVVTDPAYADQTILNTVSYSHTTGSGSASVSFRIAGDLSYVVIDTNQVKCYDETGEITCPAPGAPFYGQDAQHLGNAPSYVDNGDGTVSDLNTGLLWQQSTDSDGDGDIDASDKLTFDESEAYCQALDLAGYTDWRLPGIKELYSLILFSGTDPSGCEDEQQCPNLAPFIDTEYFDFAYGDTDAGERLIDAQYASSDAYVADLNKVFGVNFADGRIKGYDLTMPGGSEKTFYVQCVRGDDYGVNNLVDNGDGTITDQATGLMWAQTDSGTGLNWEEALARVQAQNDADYLGYNDWRLPDAKELQSLLDYTRSPDSSSSAAIDPLFSVTEIVNEGSAVDYPYYWASTTHAAYGGSGENGAYVAFGRALGWMQLEGQTCYTLIDIHGAGAQRSDPKSGSPADYYLGPACSGGSAYGRGPQGDIVRIDNYVRLVRDVDAEVTPVQILNVTATPAECEVSFAAEITGTEPIDWWWDFGAWGTSTTTNPVVDFGASGSYPYTLTVTNGGGAYSDTVSSTVTVTCCTPVRDAAFSWEPPTPWVGEVVTFTASASGSEPITYSWDFGQSCPHYALAGLVCSFSNAETVGDESIGSGATATYTYTVAGVYTVMLTVDNPCGQATVAHAVIVRAPAEQWRIYLPLVVAERDS